MALAGLGFWEWDIAADSLLFSRQLRELFDIPAEQADLTREHLIAKVQGDDVAKARRSFWPLMDSPADTRVEFRILAEGPTRYVRAITRVERDPSGAPLRVRGIIQDVSEEKQALRIARLEAQDRFEANKLVTLNMLLRGMEHEINNPNGLILLGAPLLRDAWLDVQPILEAHYDAQGDFPVAGLSFEQMRVELPRIGEDVLVAATRIRRLITDLRQYASVSKSSDLQTFDINSVVRAAYDAVQGNLQGFAQVCTLHLEEDLPQVSANFGRMKQLLEQLLANAFEAAPEVNRELQLHTRLGDAANTLHVEICDNGDGIAEEDLVHLADPFFTTKRSKGHSGLGLAIAAVLVNEFSGRLRHLPMSPQGTRAVLEVPCVDESMMEACP